MSNKKKLKLLYIYIYIKSRLIKRKNNENRGDTPINREEIMQSSLLDGKENLSMDIYEQY